MTQEPVQRKLHFVLDAYKIEPKGTMSFSFFSMANEVFFLKDRKGRDLVLKNCLKNRSAEDLGFEIDIMEHLNSHGCGAPVPVRAANGDRMVHSNGDTWLMTERLRGYMPLWHTKLKDWHLRGAVRGLATYHKAISTMDPAKDTGRIKSWEFDRIAAWNQSLEAQLEADSSGRESVKGLRELMPRFREVLARLRTELSPAALEDCARLIIHGDFHCFNIVYRWRRFAACYDFDFSRYDLRLFDIAWSMGMVMRHFYHKEFGDKIWSDDFEPAPEAVERLEYEGLVWFVREYRRVAELPAAELAHLPAMQLVLVLHNLRFFRLENSEAECMEHLGWYRWNLDSIEKAGPAYEAAVRRAVKELS